jgi:hypothetical protein
MGDLGEAPVTTLNRLRRHLLSTTSHTAIHCAWASRAWAECNRKDTAAKVAPSSVELDAIPADKLRQLVRECIERHVDQEQFEILKAAEESERELLKKWAGTYGGKS